MAHLIYAPAILFASIAVANAFPETIKPSTIWPDDRGKHIQAHGGGIVKFGDTWYWYGEDRAQDNEKGKRYVACYSSTDLVHWKFRNQVIKDVGPDEVGPRWVLERPKVYFNAKTKKFVMYMHIDGPSNPKETDPKRSNYALARVGIAVSDTPDGHFQYVRSFRPLGQESRDIGQFIDDDGSAYLIFESRPTKGFFIAKLSDDYMDVKEKTAFIKAPLEGGALVHYNGLYYVVASAMTGWDPNPNKYATAQKLEGPWSEFKDIAPPAKKTYGSQSTMLLKVVGTKTTSVIFMGDEWRPKTQWDSRYLWMPLEIGNGKLWLPQPKEWTLDVRTGETSTEHPASGSSFDSIFAKPTATPAPTPFDTPAPSSTPVSLSSDTSVATPTPSETPPESFKTVAEAQQAALRRYPDLGVTGSKLNAAFLTRYKLYQQQQPEYFRDSSWPMHLADEAAQSLSPQ